ncbi:MAG: hypothetical protein ABFD08_05765 [Syntrophomonas sp.]
MKLKTMLLLLLFMTFSITSLAADKAVGFKKINQKGDYFYYSGNVILKGKFDYSRAVDENDFAGDQVCFVPSEKYGTLIPRDKDDSRMPWFCFKNTRRAKDLLGLSDLLKNPKICEISGTATVEIVNYVVDKRETETNDIATLVKVINKSKLSTKNFSNDGQKCQ